MNLTSSRVSFRVSGHAITRYRQRVERAVGSQADLVLQMWCEGRAATDEDLGRACALRLVGSEYRVGRANGARFLMIARERTIVTILELNRRE